MASPGDMLAVINGSLFQATSRKITDRFRGIHRIFPNLMKENRRMSTCNRLDLQTRGSQPIDDARKPPQSLEWFPSVTWM